MVANRAWQNVTTYLRNVPGPTSSLELACPLDSRLPVVHAFLRGESPEGIAESFPALTLEQVLGSLAFYLANREEIDQCLRQGAEDFERLRQQAHQNSPGLYARLADARQRASRPGA
jgi:hypothetical protein